jgi:hypothetical protein
MAKQSKALSSNHSNTHTHIHTYKCVLQTVHLQCIKNEKILNLIDYRNNKNLKRIK